ncbi:hypothetical protein D8L93_05540 [Sodalis-like symbiont of Bactericera trigonica]|nr:hypothetical protein D8L93_05540 [Sodalis-like symbiont of Bactericera trigonica]
MELCLAAVNYPDGGLPILVTGASGVGKSHLAALLHRYTGETGVIQRGARLVELNCADYANNPELLSSTLFGYVKGAFTGADKEKTGLLDEADGGFFFLYEVHRLSAKNQEKLFLFMDKGYFYRLGDNRQPCHARVRFLFATTENSENVLLTTFRRRIPVMVELPSSKSSPFSEKLALVSTFFQAEAPSFKQDITVSTEMIRYLIALPGRGNIGELKNRIKVLCASAFTQGEKNSIRFVGNLTPQEDKRKREFSLARKSLSHDTVVAGKIAGGRDIAVKFLPFCQCTAVCTQVGRTLPRDAGRRVRRAAL